MKQAGIVDIINNVDATYPGNLRHYFRKLMGFSNLRAPYHNLRHWLHVLWQSYDGAMFHKLSPDEVRDIGIATLFHDAGHSGKIGNDSAEIERALEIVHLVLLPEDEWRFKNISYLIRATQFPYVIPVDELTISARIIRDADMSQNFSPVWIQQSWIGLATEMGVDPVAFLHSQPGFLTSIKFWSMWGQRKFGDALTEHIKEVEGYISIMKDGPEDLLKAA